MPGEQRRPLADAATSAGPAAERHRSTQTAQPATQDTGTQDVRPSVFLLALFLMVSWGKIFSKNFPISTVFLLSGEILAQV